MVARLAERVPKSWLPDPWKVLVEKRIRPLRAIKIDRLHSLRRVAMCMTIATPYVPYMMWSLGYLGERAKRRLCSCMLRRLSETVKPVNRFVFDLIRDQFSG